jgi:transposase
MEKVRFVGLDVHEESITLAVAESDGSSPAVFRRIPHDLNVLVRALKDLSARAQLKIAYEAGSTGFGLQRKLAAAGFECLVVAPSRVPTQGKSKTDAEDAMRLARFLRSGDLTGIYVPDAEVEGLRTLTRAREDALGAQQRARGQLRQFLVREGFRYEGSKTKWTKAHLDWVRKLEFNHPLKALVRDDYLREVELVAARIARLSEQVGVAAEKSPLRPLISALQALRGVQVLTAVTIAAEVGDFRRFDRAKHFMSYLGLVPRESSSGDRQWLGSITKAGNSHLRRVLGEAAWLYRFNGKAKAIAGRRKHASSEVQQIALKAEDRLHQRWRRMTLRGKENNKINIAVARELAGFVWAVGREMAKAAWLRVGRLRRRSRNTSGGTSSRLWEKSNARTEDQRQPRRVQTRLAVTNPRISVCSTASDFRPSPQATDTQCSERKKGAA